MSAPKGNKFYLLAENPGAPKKFGSSQELWKKAEQYFQWCDDHPIQTIEYHGRDAKECLVPKMRAYTWQGLAAFCGINSFEDYKSKNPSYQEFSAIIAHIGNIIFEQKFTAAAAGVLNQNIIAREMGLVEKKQYDVKTEQPLFPDQHVSADHGDQ